MGRRLWRSDPVVVGLQDCGCSACRVLPPLWNRGGGGRKQQSAISNCSCCYPDRSDSARFMARGRQMPPSKVIETITASCNSCSFDAVGFSLKIERYI